jgi:hypothetical protein
MSAEGAGSNEHGLHRRAFVGYGAAALTGLACAPVAHGAERAGQIEDVRGEGYAEDGSTRRTLAPAAPVFIADRVGTGPASRLAIHLGQRTKVRLGAETRLTIDRYLVDAGGDLTLDSGAILFDRQAGAPPAPVRIRSPFGLIAVRGTVFFAGPSNGVFGVFVQRGRVAVTGGGRTVVLQQNQGTNIASPGAAPTPPTTWGAVRLQTAMASVSA